MKVLAFSLFSVFLLCSAAPGYSQTQIGEDIDGEHAHDQSGYSIALSSDGLRVAIGASNNEDNGRWTGHVRVYEWTGMTWTQIGEDIDGIQEGENAGRGVSMSPDGSRVAVGAYMNDDGGFDGGQVRLYEWDGMTWQKMGESISARTFNQWMGLGESISMSDDRVAVGVPGAHYEGKGYVQIYEWIDGEWIQQGQDIEGEARGDGFGASVSLSVDGNRVAIGAPNNDDNGAYSGHVRVYEWSGSEWHQLGLDIDGEEPSSGSGGSVALSADGLRVAIGAAGNGGNGFRAGHVRIYEWDGLKWNQLGSDIDGKEPWASFGESVSLSANGDIVAIGGHSPFTVGNDVGVVLIYRWDGSEWLQQGKEISGEAANDFFGISVALSYDGEVVAAGAYRNDGNGPEAGHVRVFDLSGVTSVVKENSGEIVVHPNPTTGPLILDLPDIGSFRIVNAQGEIIHQGNSAFDLPDLSGQPSGTYYLHIRTRSGWSNTRIIKL